MKRRLSTLLVLVIAALALPAEASKLFDPADRSSADDLRAFDLASVLDGGPGAPASALEAFQRLPDKCHEGGRRAVADNCEPDLRCQWLSARFDAARAWTRGDEKAKRQAATRLHLLAGALDAGRRCERGSRSGERWNSDADLALVDAARVDLALLTERGPGPGGPVLASAEKARIDALVARARSGGVGSLAAKELRAASALLRRARQRHDWLDQQPNIARLREGLITLWGPLGGVPEGCGERLLQADMLSDRWRGFLVRESVPEALECLGSRYARELKRSGQSPRDRRAASLGEALADEARRDAGGRRFGTDPEVGRRVGALVAGLEPAAPVTARAVKPAAKAPAKKRAKAGKSSPASSGRSAGAKPAPSQARKAARPDPPPSGRVDMGLVERAGRVSALLGGRDDLVARARSARSAVERDRALQSLIVTLHRSVCAPLESVNTADLDAVRRALFGAPLGQDQGACRQVEGERGLDELLRAAPRLQRERWAAQLRGAARSAALGRRVEAREALEDVPGSFRGATWSLLRAWVARLENDPVAASRALARIDDATLARLRSSPNEGLARVAAHAWAATRAGN